MIRVAALAAGSVILLLAVACWWQGRAIKGLRADLVTAAQDLAVLRTVAEAKDRAIADLRADLAARDTALAERDRLVADFETRRAAERATLKEAMRHDRTVRDWADAPLPDAVRGLLQ